MKRKEGAWFWFEPVYRNYFILIVSHPADVPKRIRKLRLTQDVEARLLREFSGLQPLGGRYSVTMGMAAIWMSPTADVAVAMHEVTHAVLQLFRMRFLPLTPESEESYAYYVGYLAAEVEKRSAKRK